MELHEVFLIDIAAEKINVLIGIRMNILLFTSVSEWKQY